MMKSHFNGQIPSEHQEQKAFVNWFRATYKGFLIYSVPNGGTRNLLEAKFLKDEGMLKGAFDLIVLTNKYPIFIEFKRVKEAKPKISKEQKEFKKFLDDNNYKNFFAFGFLDGMEKIKEVIDGKN